MKKIMIAMGAVMSLALGAFAVNVTSGTLKNAVMFDGIAPGTSIVSGQFDSQYTTADGYTSYIGDGGAHWECTGSTEDSVITNLTGSLDDNFLQIDQTDALYRWMNQIEEGSTNTVSSQQGIYFASKVQFTASDETNGASLVTGGDKLLIWLRAADTNEDDVVDGTNLIITASASFPGGTPTDFVIDNYNVVPGEWYQLLVKSDYSLDGIEFTVMIGSTNASSEAELTKLVSNDISKFYSMDAEGTDKHTIAKVGFKGTGAADDIEFGTYTIAADMNFQVVGGDEYPTITDAIGAAPNGSVIKALKSCTIEGATVPLSQSYILDLAGCVLTYEGDTAAIANSGELVITNSTATVGSIVTTDSAAYVINNYGTLTICGGKFNMAGDTENNPIYNEGGTTAVYFINTANNTAADSVLVPETEGADAGYWVINEVSFVQTWKVTFSTNETVVAEYTTNVVNEQSLEADQIPAFTGGAWDVDPTNAVITCATNFNYTISGSNWPAAWSDDSAYAAAYTSKLTTWMTNNNISSMDTLTVADETAFLLNIAPDAADKTIDATAITIDGTTVKITVDQELGSAYGVVYLMYGSTPALGSVKTITFVDGEGDTPSSMTTLEGETATAQFYKVGVGFAAPVTAEP